MPTLRDVARRAHAQAVRIAPLSVDVGMQLFAAFLNSKLGEFQRMPLHRRDRLDAAERSICGEHGRVAATFQNLCPQCGGIVHDLADIERLITLYERGAELGLYDHDGVEARRRATLERTHGRIAVAEAA